MERIFNKYRYSRRVFLERGMRFAAGGLTTALAQEARRRGTTKRGSRYHLTYAGSI